MKITYPPGLPVSARRDDIAAAIRDHQVVIVAGETGSGKTTQLPKICLESGTRHTRRTRPPADDRPHPAAPDRGPVGGGADRGGAWGPSLGDLVGYQVRFTDKTSKQSRVKADDRRHPARGACSVTGCCAATTRSSSTRLTSAVSTSTSCWATCASLLPKRPDLKAGHHLRDHRRRALREALRRARGGGERADLPGRGAVPAAGRPCGPGGGRQRRRRRRADRPGPDRGDRGGGPGARGGGPGRRAGVPSGGAGDPRHRGGARAAGRRHPGHRRAAAVLAVVRG
ncbi:hypothetical protein [Nocardioides convexus]|uniref:hypothetical protein n=1 Tax=Nocardioides convexus TaxID=2712224 RepID=UPI0024188989|nr:hypothetical protein [Nocardioides convexus]